MAFQFLSCYYNAVHFVGVILFSFKRVKKSGGNQSHLTTVQVKSDLYLLLCAKTNKGDGWLWARFSNPF